MIHGNNNTYIIETASACALCNLSYSGLYTVYIEDTSWNTSLVYVFPTSELLNPLYSEHSYCVPCDHSGLESELECITMLAIPYQRD